MISRKTVEEVSQEEGERRKKWRRRRGGQGREQIRNEIVEKKKTQVQDS